MYLRKGDQLILTSMDDLACSLVDLHTIVEDLVVRSVVRFLRKGQTYLAKADPISILMGSVAEFECSTIKERQARRGLPERRRARSIMAGELSRDSPG